MRQTTPRQRSESGHWHEPYLVGRNHDGDRHGRRRRGSGFQLGTSVHRSSLMSPDKVFVARIWSRVVIAICWGVVCLTQAAPAHPGDAANQPKQGATKQADLG